MATRTPSGQSGSSAEGERLQKILARAGFGSRRAAEPLIADGRVTVDGAVARLGQRVDTEHARVEVDGVPVTVRDGVVYYLLNKPRRVVTTARDPEGRRTAVDLVPTEPRVFPVGRLDYNTEGLLVLTNDGDLAQLVTHPRHGIEKTYLAEVSGVPRRATGSCGACARPSAIPCAGSCGRASAPSPTVVSPPDRGVHCARVRSGP